MSDQRQSAVCFDAETRVGLTVAQTADVRAYCEQLSGMKDRVTVLMPGDPNEIDISRLMLDDTGKVVERPRIKARVSATRIPAGGVVLITGYPRECFVTVTLVAYGQSIFLYEREPLLDRRLELPMVTPCRVKIIIERTSHLPFETEVEVVK